MCFSTVIYVARAGKFVGYIEIDDRVKAEAAEAIAALKRLGVQKCVMMTGDRPARAAAVAD